MPKISIIIPVYNAQEYLKRCLDSACNQTLKDIEIICVDDCSTDNSVEILQKYSKKHENLVISRLEKNQGESFARNAGLNLAQGEYLAFVDNDDEIDLDFCEKLYEKAAETGADISRGQAIETDYHGQDHVSDQLKEGDDKLFFVSYWWSAIYKRSMIVENDISFSTEHCLGGDLLFLNEAVMAAQNLQVVNGVYYRYYRRKDSGDSEILSKEKVESALSIYEMIADNVNRGSSPTNPAYNFVFYHFVMGCFYLALKNEEIEVKKLCAKVAIDIFAKCDTRGELGSYFAKTAPHLFMLLNAQDHGAVEDVLIKCRSRMELIVSGLRARIKNK